MPSAENGKATVSTDLDELARRIRLPYRPTAAQWQTARLGAASADVPGPTDWALVAVLSFAEGDAEKLMAEAGKRRRPTAIGVEPLEWFPPELKAQLVSAPGAKGPLSRVSGDAYDAADFAKPPLSAGFLLRIGSSPRFLLRLQTM
jgi:hypothetical protein